MVIIVGVSISQEKCYQYWPDELVAGGYYGNLRVAMVNRVHKQHYTITQFTIKSDEVCVHNTPCTVYMSVEIFVLKNLILRVKCSFIVSSILKI